MSRTGQRTRLAEGVYRDNLGLAASVKVGRRSKEKRFPFGTDLRDLKAWRDAEKVKLRGSQILAVRGTLGAELGRYLRVVKGSLAKATFKSRRSEVRAWVAQIGGEDPRKLTSLSIREAISVWREAGKSAKTIQHRMRTLAHAWRTLYGQSPPLDGIDIPKPPKRRPAFVSADIIKRVEAQLRAFESGGRKKGTGGLVHNSCQRARFMVIATCGMRPAQLKRMTAADLDLERRVVMIPAAKGGEPVGLWLNDDMLAAWQTFVQADAWGHFDTRGFGRLLRKAGWPQGIRPYNARHAVGIELAERGIPHRVIADLLGHRDDRTTREFYVPVLSSPLRKASESLAGRFDWPAPVAGTVRKRKRPKGRAAQRAVS